MANDSELEGSWAGELGASDIPPAVDLEYVEGYGDDAGGFGIQPWNVFGKDDRVPVPNTEEFPWRCICALDITTRDNTTTHGTGWLIGPGTVITAGHCVYRHQDKGEVLRIEVFPGCYGKKEDEKPFSSCIATEFRYPGEWVAEKKRVHDYGAILLPRDCRYGDELGWFGLGKLSDTSLDGLLANLSGYPGDKPPYSQWFHARPLTRVTAASLRYQNDTFEGHSGAPLWWLKDGERYVVGIHNAGSEWNNHATRVNQAVFDHLKRWKAEGM